MEQAASPSLSILAELHEKHKERQARIRAAAIKDITVNITPPPQEPIALGLSVNIPKNLFDIIIVEFCDHFKIRQEDILSQRRLNYIADRRQLLAYMLYWLTDYTNYKIAGRMNKDPTTILYAIKKIQSNLPLYRKDIEELEARIRPLLPSKRK